MARNTGAIYRIYELFNFRDPVRVTTAQLNDVAQGDGTRRYRDLITEGTLREVSRRTLADRQVEYTAILI